MYIFFLAIAALGTTVLVLQILLSLVGFDHELADDVDLEQGLGLLSVRAIAAGIVGFGLGGLGAMEAGLSGSLALVIAVLPGIAGAYATAWSTRQMLRLEQDGTVRMENAVGQSGIVHLSIPTSSEGAGKVQFELQGRTVEMKAVSAGEAIPTGTPVTIAESWTTTLSRFCPRLP